jgi:hypothetical protein
MITKPQLIPLPAYFTMLLFSFFKNLLFCKMHEPSGPPSWVARTSPLRETGPGRTGHPGATPTGARTSPTGGRARTACCWSWRRGLSPRDGGTMFRVRDERDETRDTSAHMSMVRWDERDRTSETSDHM